MSLQYFYFNLLFAFCSAAAKIRYRRYLRCIMAFGSPSCSTALCCSPHFLPILECIISERLSQSQFPNYSAAIQAAAVGLRATDEGEFVSNFRTNIITPFHGPQPPPCSPISFLRRLVRHAHCSETAFVTALYYLDIIALTSR